MKPSEQDALLFTYRSLVQKIEREHQAEQDFGLARTRFLETWDAPPGSETRLQALQAMMDCEKAVTSTRLITTAALYEARCVLYPEEPTIKLEKAS